MGSDAPNGKHGRVPPVVVVAGPTASGKSAAALEIARAFGGVVINADSMQVYRELPILTAQPSPEDQARVPHRLYGVLSAADGCTVGRWRQMALAAIDEALADARLPVVVGGTGMYLKALIEGLAPVPPIAPELRAEVAARHRAIGAAAFHAELARLDPAMAARLSPNDTQRVRRAYEVVVATGRSLADFQRAQAPAALTFVILALMPPRDLLYRTCDLRCSTMVAAGAVEETRRLLDLHLDPSLPAMKAVGVRELGRYVAGELDLDQALDLFKRATRQYAKRQYTWFRNQLPGARVFAEQFSESLRSEIFSFIRISVDRLGISV
ncbi:MAG TPA: tRNA (adenosine(37)-N6)-dimethylallyltransferase MiaA [Alphaproteobacteria bacterium]